MHGAVRKKEDQSADTITPLEKVPFYIKTKGADGCPRRNYLYLTPHPQEFLHLQIRGDFM